MSDLVKIWMDHFGLTDRDDFEPTGLHWDLIEEEFWELDDAAFSGLSKAEIIKEAGDLIWVTKFFLWKMGVDPNEVERLIFESNMTKLVNGRPLFNTEGKVMKGPNYVKPNMEHL